MSRPIVRPDEGNIRYIDHASTEDLRKKYAINDGHDLAELMEISYVWTGGPLRGAVIPDNEVFDYALASHVIEHVPDVIGWINNILSVLKDDGLLCLAIPDKRYTFDLARETTTAATLYDHHARGAKVPTAQQLFDHFTQVVKVGNDEIADLWAGRSIAMERHHDDALGFHIVKEALASGNYMDCHASVFTPKSFLAVMSKLIGVGLIEARVVDFYDTAFHTQEFVCVLQKYPGGSTTEIDALLALMD